MNYLLSLSICLLLITSCSPSIVRGFQKQEKVILSRDQLTAPVDATQLRKYNMSFDLNKRHFSGILLIKQTEENSYRAFFTTHFGLTIFDFEITANDLYIHHCIEPLQKKKILNLLHTDFTLLLGLNWNKENPGILYRSSASPTDGSLWVYRLSEKPAKGYYRFSDSGLDKIQIGSGLSKRILCNYPNSILLCHTFPRLRIRLEELP